MQSICPLPDAVMVRAKPAVPVGLAVFLRFRMSHKNDFSYLLFLDANGCASVSQAEFLRDFDQQWSMAIMDYGDPRSLFTGHVAAKVMSNSDLADALKAFQEYREYVSYPDGYEEKLKAALKRGQDPAGYELEVTTTP